MKLNYYQLEPQLKKLACIYMVSGDEPLLKQDTIQLIRKAAKQAHFNERIRVSAEMSTQDEALYQMLYSQSLSMENQLIELDFRDNLPNKTIDTILQEYLKNPAQNKLILIDADKLEAKTTKSGWYKAIESQGVVVTIWPVPREQLPKWIINRGKKYKLNILPAAADLLADFVEGNLIAAAQMIEKIYLLGPQGAVNETIINSILTDESYFTIFDLVETILNANTPRALHILQTLKADNTEPVLILWAITRELRLLADFALQLQQGMNYESLFQKNKIFPRRQSGIRKFLNKYTSEKIWQLLKHAAEIDKIIKGAKPDNIWEALELFCLRMI